ncbi:MAG: ABC transporter permease [Pseudonocardia sp.]|nr:ABC transporter permease [Pseudonocardia sp.]
MTVRAVGWVAAAGVGDDGDGLVLVGGDRARRGMPLPSRLVVSLGRVGAGLGIGLVAGLVLLFRLGENLIDSNMAILRAVPTLALLSIFIIWFGIDEQPKILLIAVGVTVHIYITTYSAIRGIDHGLVEAARTFGVRRSGMVRMVILPGAVPGFFAGLRFALSGSWLSLIYVETLNARQGLGRMMNDARDYSQLDVVFVVLVIYALLGLGCYALVNRLESWLLVWRRSYGENR